MKVIVITPVRNEEHHIRFTLESMIRQTLLPIKWIIVDDGSTDDTAKIINEHLDQAPFIEYVYKTDRGFRKPAQGVIEAFYEGFSRINVDYDIVAKFDGDLDFPKDSLEKISAAFQNDPDLGITGGIRYERSSNKGPFKKVIVPKGFVGGPFKFYRKECLQDIGGLIPRAGWDGVDTIKANMRGWKTGELESLKIQHLKPTGSARGEGFIKANEKYGDVSYYMGGYLWYFFLRVIGRSLQWRNPMVGYYMVKGYLRARLDNQIRESSEFRKYLKKVQIKNTLYYIHLLSRLNKV